MRGLTVSQKVFIVAMTTCTIVTVLNTNIYAPKLNFVDVSSYFNLMSVQICHIYA